MLTQFQVPLGALYDADPITSDQAEAVGCPGADWRLIGRHGMTYGYLMAAGRKPGALVNVPGWNPRGRRGLRVTFVPWSHPDSSDFEPLEGYLGE